MRKVARYRHHAAANTALEFRTKARIDLLFGALAAYANHHLGPQKLRPIAWAVFLFSAAYTAYCLATDRFAGDVRDRVSDGMDRASSRVSDLRDQAEELYSGPDHTMRNILTFAAGVGVGIGAAMLFAPASGEEIRGQISEKVQDIGERVRDRFTARTGTENV